MDAHLSAYRYLRKRNKLWMPTWVWIAIVGLLCLAVGWSAGWMAQRSMRDPQAVLSAPQTGEGQEMPVYPFAPAAKTDGVTELLDKMEELSKPHGKPAPFSQPYSPATTEAVK